jgi:uncharacterized protein (TIGR03083 family)
MTTESTPVDNKTDLLSRIGESWDELQDTIARLSHDQLTGPSDAGGWTAKDHIAHLAAWENSMVSLLQGEPRHEGLGVSEQTYLEGSEDEINDDIFQRVRDLSLAEVKNTLDEVHREMLSLLDTLSDEDLQKPYSHYLPDEPGKDDGSPIIDRVSGNTHEHFDTHRAYIERIAGSA